MLDFINEKVIVKGKNSGIFYGTLEMLDGERVLLKNCRNIIDIPEKDIFDLAYYGIEKAANCVVTSPIDKVLLTDTIEIVLCAKDAVWY